ncbi:MAG: zinc-dependent alcohol dehydrogenase [Thermacetogeniaceae bacterium]|jgi:L-iditol 2-dehydrogenase
MKAAVIIGPREITVNEVDAPRADANHILVKVTDICICGSDLQIWNVGLSGWRPGHEYSGIVVDPGPLSGKINKGDRVTSITINPDFSCLYCLAGQEQLCNENVFSPGSHPEVPGACSEYFAARADLIRKLPDNVSNEEGAIVEACAVALHAARKVEIKSGDRVLISGTGCIGSLIADYCRYFGADLVVGTDVNMTRASRLVESGTCNAVFDAKDPDINKQLLEMSGGGFDICFEASGVLAAINQSLIVLKKGHTMVLVGACLDRIELLNLLMGEYKLVSSYAYTVTEFDEVISLMAAEKIDYKRYIGKVFKLEDIQQAYEYRGQGDTPDFKVLVKM